MSLFVTGHQRSGTSLLASLLVSHPDVELTNEYGIFFNLGQPRRRYNRHVLRSWWRKRNYPLFPYRLDGGDPRKGAPLVRNLAFTSRYLWAVNRRSEGHVTARTVDGALTALFPGARIVGDKHPDYWFQMDKLTAAESLNCLLIIRDPRDMAYSVVQKARGVWKNSWPASLQDVRTVAKRWVRLIDAMKRNEASLFTIRYEDLVAEPAATLNRLGEWLDIDPGGFPIEYVRPDRGGKYKTGLTTEEIASINDIVGPVLHQAGYE